MNATLGKILDRLDRQRHLFDLDRGDLGQELCKAATDGVQYAIAREEDPDGVAWAPLSDAYREAKEFSHPGNPIAVLEGAMADPREVAGTVEVSRDEAAVTYGVSDQARQEATWFQEGNANQPPRPFWGLTADAKAESRRILDERFSTA